MNVKTALDLHLRRVWLGALILSLAFGSPTSVLGQVGAEAHLRKVVEQLYDFYQKRDIEGVMSLWSKKSPGLAVARNGFLRTFTWTGTIELKNLTIESLTIEGTTALIQVVLDFSATDKLGRPSWPSGRMNRIIRFVLENQEWKVWHYAAAEDELAARLVQVDAEAERNALFAPQSKSLTPGLFPALTRQARQLFDQGRYKQAMTAYRLALQVAERLGDKNAIVAAYNGIGVVHAQQGDYDVALENFQKCLNLAEEIDDKPQTSTAFNNIGIIYYEQGNKGRALEYYLKGLRLQELLGEKSAIAVSLHNVGNVYRAQGDSAQALEYMQRSLKLKEEMGNVHEIAATLNNIGENLTYQGNYTKALEYLQRGLKMSESLGEEGIHADSLGFLGILSSLQGNHTMALEYLERKLQVSQKLGNKPAFASTLYRMGEVRFSQGEYTQAAELADRAVELAKQLDISETVWRADALAGRAYLALNQPSRARKSFLNAIDTIERLRTQVGGGEPQQQRSFENQLSPYHGMSFLSVEQNDAAEALVYAERAKGRVLLDVLQSGRVNITRAITGEERQQESELRAQTVSLNVQLRERQQQPRDDAGLSDLEARLQKARLAYEAFQTDLYAAHPELRVQRGQMQPLTSDEIGRLLPDPGTALLEFEVLQDRSLLFVLTGLPGADQGKVDLKVYTLPIKQKDLAELTQRFSQSLAERRLSMEELGMRLYDLLLKPARAQLRGIHSLVIVPDDVLWGLPFQALQASKRRYVVEDFVISYAQSLSVLRETRRQPARSNTVKAMPMLLAFGNPALGSQTLQRARVTMMDEPLEPLPDTERQVKLLGHLYGKDQSNVYTGINAQEERLKAEAGNYRIIHLATHGILNNSSPMYSQLVLSTSQTNSSEDGLLEAWEIMKLDLRADLVVLSACETARGRVGAGEGIIGLSWALFVAGAPTAVVTQWKVESASSTEFMLEFHKQLKSNSRGTGVLHSAAALRQASLKLLKGKQYDHPFYWAPFVVIGNGMGSRASNEVNTVRK